jgi:hypothetical protein
MLLQKVMINVSIDSFLTQTKTTGHFWRSLPTTPRTIFFRRALDKGEM